MWINKILYIYPYRIYTKGQPAMAINHFVWLTMVYHKAYVHGSCFVVFWSGYIPTTLPQISRGCFSIGCSSVTHLKLKSRWIVVIHNLSLGCQIVWNFAQDTAVILPYPVQNFKTIWQLGNKLGETRFHVIWVYDTFRADVPYFNSPNIDLTRNPPPP